MPPTAGSGDKTACCSQDLPCMQRESFVCDRNLASSKPSPEELTVGTAEADLSIRTAVTLRVRGCGGGTDETPTLSVEPWGSGGGGCANGVATGTACEAARLSAAAFTAFCLSEAWTGKTSCVKRNC